jgi:hypothetical protein
MFTPDDRARLRSELLAFAASDTRLSGAAITGSAAEEREDRWSDIDLAFGVADPAELTKVLADWTARLYDRNRAVDHVDVHAGAWIYRVFLLADSLQVDLAFVPETEFRALAPSFRLVSGTAKEPRHAPPPAPAGIVGFAWLYALHARSCIARRKPWQAEYMISGVRDHALALACLRHDLPTVHGRGIDQLPADVTAPFAAALVRSLDEDELTRAFRAAVSALQHEIQHADRDLAARLEGPLRLMTDAGS